MGLTEEQKKLRRRILAISYKHNLSHLGSCLTAVDIINDIYKQKKPNEKFVLSAGHAGLALYVVLEHYGYGDAEKMFLAMGVHPERNKYTRHIEGTVDGEEDVIDCSTGSLGQGLPIAVGMALANRKKNVYCLISDGEASEGSISEARRIAVEQKLDNLKVYLNFNGWGAYKYIKLIPDDWSWYNIRVVKTTVKEFPFLKGQAGHYHVMSEQDYMEAIKILE